MSDRHTQIAPEPEQFKPADAGALPKLFLGLGVLGLLGSLITAFISRDLFMHSYLFGFEFCFLLCIGCFFWTCLHHATDADWTVVVRRQLENLASLIPWLALFFIPLFLCRKTLWPWWDMDPHSDALLEWKKGYLNQPFFIARTLFFFGALSLWTWLLRRNSIAQDTTGGAAKTLFNRNLSIAGIPLMAICITFSGYDWLIGMFWKWFSTMWGVYLFAGAAGSSMALLIIVTTWLREKGYLKPVSMEHYHTMGKFLLAFVIFWAYIGFSQYMLIWYTNIPEETIYFRERNAGAWWPLSLLLVFGRFFVPLPILLTQWIKKKPGKLKLAAAWILLMEMLDVFLIVMPNMDATHGVTGFGGLLVKAFAAAFPLIGIAGVLGFLYFRKLASAPVFPLRDPRLLRSIKLVN